MASKSTSSSTANTQLPFPNHSLSFSHQPSLYPRPPPKSQLDLPIRLSPYPPQLSVLDALCKHKNTGTLHERKHPPMPRSLVYEKPEDEEERSVGPSRQKKREILDNHIADRVPYVRLASRRLQAVLGTRNERVFDLPSLSPSTSAAKLGLENLYDIPDGSIWGVQGGIAKSRGGYKSTANHVDLAHDAGAAAKMSTKNKLEKRTSAHLEPQSSAMPNVDKVTGAGLRQFLLSKGREMGSRQRQSTSITICDLTPDIRTHGYANKFLGKWEGAVENGQRIEVHEVDLPYTSINISTGEETRVTDTWIWFLISRPILGRLSTKSSDHLDRATPSSSTMNSDWPESSTREPSSFFNQPIDSPRAPPNFPYPIPNSWIVFACPKAHVTCYSKTTETVGEDKSSSHHSVFSKPKNISSKQSRNQTTCHRADYDLSHFGIPIFEFSSHHLFDGHRIEFSSVDGMEGWDEKDCYLPYTQERYELEREHADIFSNQEQNEYGEEQGIDPPCPNHGHWWHKFYRLMYEDAKRWKKIKHAMGRGKCRVTVRWAEPESKGTDTTKATAAEDEDPKEADRLLRDIGLGISGVAAHARKKSRSSLGKEKIMVGKHRATRSETRRRSSLSTEILLSDGLSEGFEHAAAKGQKKEKLRGNRKSAPVVRSGFL